MNGEGLNLEGLITISQGDLIATEKESYSEQYDFHNVVLNLTKILLAYTAKWVDCETHYH